MYYIHYIACSCTNLCSANPSFSKAIKLAQKLLPFGYVLFQSKPDSRSSSNTVSSQRPLIATKHPTHGSITHLTSCLHKSKPTLSDRSHEIRTMKLDARIGIPPRAPVFVLSRFYFLFCSVRWMSFICICQSQLISVRVLFLGSVEMVKPWYYAHATRLGGFCGG